MINVAKIKFVDQTHLEFSDAHQFVNFSPVLRTPNVAPAIIKASANVLKATQETQMTGRDVLSSPKISASLTLNVRKKKSVA